MPAVPKAARSSTVGWGRAAILVTIVGWVAYTGSVVTADFRSGELTGPRVVETVAYVIVVGLLAASACAYLVGRHGYLMRTQEHQRVPRAEIHRQFSTGDAPTLTVLVPSYKEDAAVVTQTLLAVALQEYPHKRIVLLIDDPPNPSRQSDRDGLEASRNLPGEVGDLLRPIAVVFGDSLARFEAVAEPGLVDMENLASEYSRASQWLRRLVDKHERHDHSDDFLLDEVIGALIDDLDAVSVAVIEARASGEVLPRERMLQLHQRLVWLFTAELTSFERKRFASLSHEPNKAMNLNSYLALMGGAYRVTEVGGRTDLVPARPLPDGSNVVADSDYVLTIDADSVLLPEYCLRLIHALEQPEQADVAVIQTPYSAYPGAVTRVERIAGATTDIQHRLHQGSTRFDATFWVGANAILRKRALDDIGQPMATRPVPVTTYIQDRTVIEDTESSIDLAVKGWRLHNYGERLAYSATPPDFGSLCIQRNRWANGGLVILPKLLANWRATVARGRQRAAWGFLLRLNYLASIAWSSLGLIVLLAFPFDDRLLSPIVVATAAPYFVIMAADLKDMGYKRTDALRIYAFNLLMLPVNLFGTVRSVIQAITNQKSAFARTPKIKGRTAAALPYALFPYLLLAFSGWTIWRDLDTGAYGHATFAAINALSVLYGLVAFVGIRNSLVDIVVGCFELFRVDTKQAGQNQQSEPWELVLEVGDAAPVPAGAPRHPTQELPIVLADGPAVGGDGDPAPDLVEAVAVARQLLEHVERRLQPAVETDGYVRVGGEGSNGSGGATAPRSSLTAPASGGSVTELAGRRPRNGAQPPWPPPTPRHRRD